METDEFIDGVTKVADVARTGLDLASNIEKCCDPNNKNKTENIAGIVGNSILLGLKIASYANQICRDNEFKQQVSMSLSTLGKLIGSQNPFYIETYGIFHNITQERFTQIMADYTKCVKSEFSTDEKVIKFWNAVTAQSCSLISEDDFDYGLSKIQEYDCARLRQNNPQFSSQYIKQVVIPEYRSFISPLFGALKSELKARGEII